MATIILKNLCPVGERCTIDGASTEAWLAGTIVGHVVLPPRGTSGEPNLCYVVELDSGFYSKGEETFVSTFVISADAPEFQAGER